MGYRQMIIMKFSYILFTRQKTTIDSIYEKNNEYAIVMVKAVLIDIKVFM